MQLKVDICSVLINGGPATWPATTKDITIGSAFDAVTPKPCSLKGPSASYEKDSRINSVWRGSYYKFCIEAQEFIMQWNI